MLKLLKLLKGLFWGGLEAVVIGLVGEEVVVLETGVVGVIEGTL